MSKITLTTIKSFIKKSPKLYIKCKSSFDGMTDCVQSIPDAGFVEVELTDKHLYNTLGVQCAWFVRGSRDYFSAYETETLTGYEVWNCCGSFILATDKQAA